MKTKYFVAKRKSSDDGYEWYDVTTTSLDIDLCKKANTLQENLMPHFYNAQQLMGFVQVELVEVK